MGNESITAPFGLTRGGEEGASSECNKAMAIGAQEHLDPLQKEEEDRRLIRSLFYLISEKSSQQPRFLPLLSQQPGRSSPSS